MKKPKPASNSEIYNGLVKIHEDVCLTNRLLGEFLRRQSEIERRLAVVERNKASKYERNDE